LYLKSRKSVVYCNSERTFPGFRKGNGFRKIPEESRKRNRKQYQGMIRIGKENIKLWHF